MNTSNPRIDFLENWNGKLFCNAFSTIRLRDDSIYQIGNKFDITLRDNWCGDAEIVHIAHFKLDKMPESMAYLDTGYSKRQTIELLQRLLGEDIVNETFSYIVLYRLTKDYHLNLRLNAFKLDKTAVMA